MSTSSIGVAVIGAGMAGRAHANGYRAAPTVFGSGLPDVRLVAIADAYEPFATDTAQRYGYERAETSWQAIAGAPKDEMLAMGIDLRDVEQPIGTLSGGERQCVAISRAVYFGAKVLILDEPTAALGVKQSGVVLKYIIQARERGLGVIFITHNPHHAYPVGDRFLLLNRGRSIGYYQKDKVTRDELTGLMAGGTELEQLSHELESAGGSAAAVGAMLEEEAEELGTASHEPSPAASEPRTGIPPA